MFKHLKLGPTIGKRTWGGLVGNLGTPVLMDGGGVTSPNVAIWTPEDEYIVENVGIPADIEVEHILKDVITGHDPQLERAIGCVLEELKKNPAPKLKRPAYPDKVKRLGIRGANEPDLAGLGGGGDCGSDPGPARSPVPAHRIGLVGGRGVGHLGRSVPTLRTDD